MAFAKNQSIYKYISKFKMGKFKNKPVRMNILVDISVRKKYKIYCIKKNYVFSERIRELIEMDLNGEINNYSKNNIINVNNLNNEI